MTDERAPDDDSELSAGLGERAKAMYQAMYRTIDDAVFLIAVERTAGEYTFTYQRSNPSHRRQTGISEAELRGRTPTEVLGSQQGATVAENYRRCVEQDAQIEYEETLDLPAGRTHWQTTLTPITDGSEVTHIVGTAQDVTEQRANQEALRAERSFLDAIIESLPYPFYVIDVEDYTIEYANSDAVASEGSVCYEITHGRGQPCDEGENPISCPLSKIIETEEATTVEHVHYDETGNERTYQVHAAPVFDDEGELRWIGESSIDITERVQYEDQLAIQRDNLELLNQIVRHDIRNDLQVVLAYTETLESYVEADGEQYVRQVLEAAQDAVEITKTARDVTEALLQSETKRSPVPLRQTLEDEVDEVQSSHEHALVTMESTVPGVDVLADGMLSSVFRNLLQNAVVHNDKETPEVAVSSSVTDERVEIRVADNGPGVPDEQKERVFQEGEHGLDSEGTGLGLYLVQMLVERYGGAVRVEDNDPEGSVFVVELPRDG